MNVLKNRFFALITLIIFQTATYSQEKYDKSIIDEVKREIADLKKAKKYDPAHPIFPLNPDKIKLTKSYPLIIESRWEEYRPDLLNIFRKYFKIDVPDNYLSIGIIMDKDNEKKITDGQKIDTNSLARIAIIEYGNETIQSLLINEFSLKKSCFPAIAYKSSAKPISIEKFAKKFREGEGLNMPKIAEATVDLIIEKEGIFKGLNVTAQTPTIKEKTMVIYTNYVEMERDQFQVYYWRSKFAVYKSNDDWMVQANVLTGRAPRSDPTKIELFKNFELAIDNQDIVQFRRTVGMSGKKRVELKSGAMTKDGDAILHPNDVSIQMLQSPVELMNRMFDKYCDLLTKE